MNNELKTELLNKFESKEAEEIEKFLNKGFSLKGQIVIASIFYYAKDHNKSVKEVLDECEKEWKRNWNYQHPDIRGNPDAPGGAGLQNRRSLGNIYSLLKIPSPLSQ